MTRWRWMVTDAVGNEIYLTQERWEHILDGHPELMEFETELRSTIRSGQRSQDALNPQKYRYTKRFANLAEDNTHVVAIVLFRFVEEAEGAPAPNNYVVTAYLKEIR